MIAETMIQSFKISEKKVFIRLKNRICETPEELLSSELCFRVIKNCVEDLTRRNSILLGIFRGKPVTDTSLERLINTLKLLAAIPSNFSPKSIPESEDFLKDKHLFGDFVEHLYNYWRNFDRFVICDSDGEDFDQHPFRTFNLTIEALTHLIRRTYRDIQENALQIHPRIYRQVCAGAEIATIIAPRPIQYPNGLYKKLNSIPIIRQVLLYPPLVMNPPMNKRKGRFERIFENPLEKIGLNKDEWLCYPAKVGSLLVLVYFCEKFFELGLSLCNLFELADEEDLKRKPDAVYIFGAPEKALAGMGVLPAVFYDDIENDMLVGAVPDRDEFGYFGYLKKMILTLHNIKKMKSAKMPFHGALVKIFLKGNKQATILSIGDTGAGKSETLEAFRELGEAYIQDLMVIADDMGSLDIGPDGRVVGYGTEIGAFLRLDDLQPGYAFGQMDRAIIMSPNQVNARIILPVTTFENLIKGYKIDYVFYANNYEEIDEDHPVIERFKTADEALKVFREGTVMSKGTTTATGLVHSYFANIFGPVQYKDLHETVSKKFFETFFKSGVFVGQMRTRLGIAGWERKGPSAAAKELLKLIAQ